MKSQRSSWRREVLSRHREALSSPPSGSDPTMTDLDWDRFERQQWLEMAQTFDPNASLAEELLVRLQGETASNAALRLDWEGILKPLQDAVGSATRQDVALELSGFSKGSSVLHFRAVQRRSVENLGEAGPAVRETPLAAPVRQLLEAVDAVENEQDVRRWMSMLDGVERLSGELERLHLAADFRFYSRSGDVRGARLTERGMGYMKMLAEPQETESVIGVTGRITELRESGHVKVKAGPRRNDTAYDVQMDPAELASMRLMLGQHVHWAVTVIANEDRLGRLKSMRYEFARNLGASEQPDLAAQPNFWPTLDADGDGVANE